MKQPNIFVKGSTLTFFVGLMLGFVLYQSGWLQLDRPSTARPYNPVIALNSDGYEIDSPIVPDGLAGFRLDSTYFKDDLFDKKQRLKEHPLDSVIYQGRRMQRKDMFHFMASSKSLVVGSPKIILISYHDSLWRQRYDSTELSQIGLGFYWGIDTTIPLKKTTPYVPHYPAIDFMSSSKSRVLFNPEDFLPYSFKKHGLPKPNSNHQYFLMDSVKLKWKHQ